MTDGPEDIYANFDSGTYNFEIIENEEEQVLWIDNNKKGVITLLDNNLKIDDGISDGFITEFER